MTQCHSHSGARTWHQRDLLLSRCQQLAHVCLLAVRAASGWSPPLDLVLVFSYAGSVPQAPVSSFHLRCASFCSAYFVFLTEGQVGYIHGYILICRREVKGGREGIWAFIQITLILP